MKKRQIILPSKKFFKSPDEDLSIRVDFEETKSLLKDSDRNTILDLSKLYDKERNDSKKYKIYGKIKMVFRNMYTGNTSYEYLKKNLYLVGDGSTSDYTGYIPYNEFAFLRKDVTREIVNYSSGDELERYSQSISLEKNYTGHTRISAIDAPYQNWNIYLSYVYGKNENYAMKYTLSGNSIYSFTAKDGVPFRVTDNDNYYTLTSPVEHGMNSGEYVILSGGSININLPIIDRAYQIDNVGDETFNSEKYVINILKSQFSGTTIISNNNVLIGKRCIDINKINESVSSYYVHLHKTLTNVNSYVIDKASFESPIWEDEKKLLYENYAGDNDYLVERNMMETIFYDFKEPFILTGLTNNLGYTPTEVYLTLIFRNGNGYFEYPPKVGYKFNFHDTWIDQHFSGSTSLENNITYSGFTKVENSNTFNFKSGQTLNTGTTLIGAFVEYNDYEFKERIISESYHKIYSPKDIFDYNQDNPSNYSGSSQNNMFGLYYQPHYRIKLRELSPYIESAKTNQVFNLPENAKYNSDENTWKWRDLYEHGYFDDEGYGTNFPFLNGMHYIVKNINLYLRNEQKYRNKQDGLIKFINKNIDC